MKRQSWLRRTAMLAVLALVVAACGGSDDEQFHLGYILPQTGPLAFLADPLIGGVELAVADINAAGGVLGNDVILSEGDEAGDAALASEAAQRLINDGIHALVGAAATPMTNAIVDAVTGAGILQCSGSNTGPAFRTLEANGLYLRTAPSDSLQGAFAADVIMDDGHSNVAIAVQATAYGTGLGDALQESLEANGASVATYVTYDPEAANFNAEVAQIVDSGATAVYIVGYDETAQVIAGLIEAGYGPDSFAIYAADGSRGRDLALAVDPNNPGILEGVMGTAPTAAEGVGDEFNARFLEERGDVETIYAAEKYDCAIILALAAELSGSFDGAEMAAVLNEVTSNGTPCDSFAACKDLIAAGEDFAYQTASGIVLAETPTGNHEPDSAFFEKWRFDANGEIEQLYTEFGNF